MTPGDPTTRLTIAVTGATGEIGRPFVRRLERMPEVGSIRAMARGPFVPGEHGWTRAEFTAGDVTNRHDVERLVRGADVVVHLAFLILGSRRATRTTNLAGSRNVFEAAVAAGCQRRLLWVPALSDWIQTLPVPLIMSTEKAERELAWRATHDARTTLSQTVASARAAGLRGLS